VFDINTFTLLVGLFTVSALLAGLQLPLISHFHSAYQRAAEQGPSGAAMKQRCRTMMDLCAASSLMFIILAIVYLIIIIVLSNPDYGVMAGVGILLVPSLMLGYTVLASTFRKSNLFQDLLESPGSPPPPPAQY
jgi:hypothetical protein